MRDLKSVSGELRENLFSLYMCACVCAFGSTFSLLLIARVSYQVIPEGQTTADSMCNHNGSILKTVQKNKKGFRKSFITLNTLKYMHQERLFFQEMLIETWNYFRFPLFSLFFLFNLLVWFGFFNINIVNIGKILQQAVCQ